MASEQNRGTDAVFLERPGAKVFDDDIRIGGQAGDERDVVGPGRGLRLHSICCG